MSFLSDIHSYWAAHATLNAALPSTQVYTGLAPESLVFPYAVITPVASAPTFTTGSPYHETFAFQISIYDTDADNVKTLTATAQAAFDYATVASSTISCIRTSSIFTIDPDSPRRVYHQVIGYELT